MGTGQGDWPIETPSKYFYLAIGGGLGKIKCLKNGTGKGFIFHPIIPALYPFWLKFYWLSYRTFIFSTLESQSWKNNNQNVKAEKMVAFVKSFDYYNLKFNFRNFFSYPIKL